MFKIIILLSITLNIGSINYNNLYRTEYFRIYDVLYKENLTTYYSSENFLLAAETAHSISHARANANSMKIIYTIYGMSYRAHIKFNNSTINFNSSTSCHYFFTLNDRKIICVTCSIQTCKGSFGYRYTIVNDNNKSGIWQKKTWKNNCNCGKNSYIFTH